MDDKFFSLAKMEEYLDILEKGDTAEDILMDEVYGSFGEGEGTVAPEGYGRGF